MSMSEMLADIARQDREAIDTLRMIAAKYCVTSEERVALTMACTRLLASAQDGERMAADARKEEQLEVRA